MIEVTENCHCGTCLLAKRVNNIQNLDDLLKCRDSYTQLRKSIMGPRMEQINAVIQSKLKSIKV
jgi:hypothetical protein